MDTNPAYRPAASDEEAYTTVSSAPPKRRAGRTKFKETRHPVYKGVRRRNADRWVCEVREPNKKSRIWLGTFATAEMAARAHDVAAIALRGRSACLNFADSAWLLPVPKSSSPKDIQKAAAEAAELFRPPENVGGSQTESPVDVVPQGLEEYVFGAEEEGYFPEIVESGWLSPPPPLLCGSDVSYGGYSGGGGSWDDMDCSTEVSLWSYSI